MKESQEEDSTEHDYYISELLTDYERTKDFGILPEAGGLNDQDPFWLECTDIIRNEVSQYEREQMKK
jgi:hypothetical protein